MVTLGWCWGCAHLGLLNCPTSQYLAPSPDTRRLIRPPQLRHHLGRQEQPRHLKQGNNLGACERPEVDEGL
ncbi:hypothetical protein GLYMA_16G045400v4 [Glycine max]|uniref:Uncharacterized protein n=2 Tax=Glycine subgen. Soja TaxID=1462606 RepID=A0A0R0FW22_SOYBN|nr:hypothetical protein JHK86_044393 [Glycine max]KAG5107596.1 hypothetical protein JHK84_044503 [Glycine max]KAH1149969.1 hypothetical protein GYH30_044137 [Glycine max]KRH06779.1 hypothetical protein GLYMA_16G045400v4 [Glycine max]